MAAALQDVPGADGQEINLAKNLLRILLSVDWREHFPGVPGEWSFETDKLSDVLAKMMGLLPVALNYFKEALKKAQELSDRQYKYTIGQDFKDPMARTNLLNTLMAILVIVSSKVNKIIPFVEVGVKKREGDGAGAPGGAKIRETFPYIWKNTAVHFTNLAQNKWYNFQPFHCFRTLDGKALGSCIMNLDPFGQWTLPGFVAKWLINKGHLVPVVPLDTKPAHLQWPIWHEIAQKYAEMSKALRRTGIGTIFFGQKEYFPLFKALMPEQKQKFLEILSSRYASLLLHPRGRVPFFAKDLEQYTVEDMWITRGNAFAFLVETSVGGDLSYLE